MRNPIGHVGSYQEYFASMADGERGWDAEFADLPPFNQAAMTWSRLNDGKKFLLHQYGAGFDLEFIATTLRERMPRMLADGDVRLHSKHPQWSDYHLSGNSRVDVGLVALALLLVTANEILLQLRQCISFLRTQRRYLFDLLLADDPVQQVVHDDQKNNYTARWADPILRVLAMPVEKRATAIAAHMQAWLRLLSPFGYKDKLHNPPWFYAHSCELAYEVALAVCAYDIDATEAVLDATGKPRKICDLQTLLQNLTERGYQLVDIDDGDSDWHAVVVNTKCYPELQQLSEQLGIPVRRYGADLHLPQE